MSKAGIEVIVEPSFWLGSRRTFVVDTFEDYWEHLSHLKLQDKQFGIEHFVCI